MLDAVTAERAVASRHDRPDLRAAQRALADSLLPGTWIDELHLVVKRHGDRVFNDDIQALQQLRQLLRDRRSGVADAKVQSWIDALTRIDRRVAELAIDEARAAGGNARKLADAAKSLARGVALLGKGKLASAVEQFAHAWDDAKDSLVKPGKKSEREHDRDRSHDGDLDD